MTKVRSKCAVCGVPLELEVADTFEGAAIAGALCPDCTDQQFLSGGGAILQMRQEPEGARFPLGKVTITGGAVEALADAGQHAATFLARHARGDWGEIGQFGQIELTNDERRRGWEATDNTGKINKSNVLNRRDRIMSEFATAVSAQRNHTRVAGTRARIHHIEGRSPTGSAAGGPKRPTLIAAIALVHGLELVTGIAFRVFFLFSSVGNLTFRCAHDRIPTNGPTRLQTYSGRVWRQGVLLVSFRGTRDMEHNPYEVGTAIGRSGEQGFARPRWQRILAVLGLSKIVEALFELLLFVGTLGFVVGINPRSIAHWQDDRPVQVFLIQRLVALPAIAVLSLWLARGLIGLRPRAMLVQAILSAMVACWALLLTWRYRIDIEFAIEEISVYPVIAARDIALYVARFCSGIVHVAVAVQLFRARGRLGREEVGVITDLSIKRFGCGSYLFASACGFVLAYGTIGITNS